MNRVGHLEALYVERRGALVLLAAAILGDSKEADDVVQDAFDGGVRDVPGASLTLWTAAG